MKAHPCKEQKEALPNTKRNKMLQNNTPRYPDVRSYRLWKTGQQGDKLLNERTICEVCPFSLICLTQSDEKECDDLLEILCIPLREKASIVQDTCVKELEDAETFPQDHLFVNARYVVTIVFCLPASESCDS
ncbi:hypothetical protein CDAR_573431 [Caerostris darwini]|uniref:Uncharacterized protein n=1 Tax=Caerostris darwini TaxID=1538125 RepID=A0AAV4VND1_9ARAC|nr:hypothetical protein CDAR_573431 [Caerostris darwini]